MDYHEIIKRLIGPINPQGETNTDNDRFLNLGEHVRLVEALVMDLEDVAAYKDRHEYSMKRAAEYAEACLERIREST